MNTRTIRALLAAAGLLALSPSVLAAEAFDNCTGFIETLPTTISTQGTWCLRQDLATGMTSGNAITVATSNVTIDCNGYKVGGLAGGVATQAQGVYAFDRSNAVIRNCNIRGFFIGALVQGAAALVEDNRFEGNTNVGVIVVSAGGVVRRNQVVNTGGSTEDPDGIGIFTDLDVDVLDNTVDTVDPRADGNGTGVGIIATNNIGGSIVGNRLRNILADGAAEPQGISGSFERTTVADNQVIGATGTGIAITCSNMNSVIKDNTIAGFATALSGCDDNGGNLISN